MYKTLTKHRKSRGLNNRRKSLSDLDKIKAYLYQTTQGLKNSAEDKLHQSLENIREKSEEVHDYLGERPIKSIGVSLVTGIVTGLCIGYYINK